MSQAAVIAAGASVCLHFSIELEDGQVIDSTRERGPARFRVGDGNLLPGFERALFGLKAGDERRLVIPAAQGFGPHNPENLQRLPPTAFRGMRLEPGLMVEFDDPRQGRLAGVVVQEGDNWVEVDFNHPLAGRTLIFAVEILEVS